jgi:hypothetical protein
MNSVRKQIFATPKRADYPIRASIPSKRVAGTSPHDQKLHYLRHLGQPAGLGVLFGSIKEIIKSASDSHGRACAVPNTSSRESALSWT